MENMFLTLNGYLQNVIILWIVLKFLFALHIQHHIHLEDTRG